MMNASVASQVISASQKLSDAKKSDSNIQTADETPLNSKILGDEAVMVAVTN